MSLLSRVELDQFAERLRPEYERALRELVEIPTVSSDPARAADVRRGAEAAARLVRQAGARARVVRTKGHPVVVGEFPAPRGAPTVVIYNHLDVQPAARTDDGWRSEPFRLVRDGDRYFGRGTTDDKGPAVAALFGARAAREAGVPVGVRLLWEHEEEIGSPSLQPVLRTLARGRRPHSVVVSDSAWLDRRRPTSIAGLRGFVGFRFVLDTADGDAHSGDVGGAARNPLAELMQVAADMHDARTGRVKVPGFYDAVVPLSARERADFRRSGFSLPAYRRDNHLHRLRTSDPVEVLERIWARPTLEVHGLAGGYTGPGIKSAVPGHGELKVSCRLVPRQRPETIERLIADFVRRRHPDVVVHFEGGTLPYEGKTTGPVADAVRDAMSFAFGRVPAFVRDGGSMGAVTHMERIFGCPIAFLNLSLPEHGYHAPNENFDWGQARGGIAAFAHYLETVAKGRPLAPRVSARGLAAGQDGVVRCAWAGADPLYVQYHDDEWGFPVDDDRRLFEKVCLEGFQAGLSWLTILRKRENFRRAFARFDPARVARFDARQVRRLLADTGIVRHRGKIESTVNNARQALALRREAGSLAAYFWRFAPPPADRPRRLTWDVLRTMAHTPASVALSRDLRARGWSFVGPTTLYAFMQAMGMVNDHLEGCAIRARAEAAARAFRRPA